MGCWQVEARDGKAWVVGKRMAVPARTLLASSGVPESIVIVGGGAAGHAAADTLRLEGYTGPVTLLSSCLLYTSPCPAHGVDR